MGKKKKQSQHGEPDGSDRPLKRAFVGKRPVIVFAHGAGAPSSSEWMKRWKELLLSSTDAIDVITFDYPYFSGGKKRAPPKAEKLIDPHTEEIKKAHLKYPGHPVVLVGKSMGSRVGCLVAEKGEMEVSAIICLGYPLRGINGAVRDGVLQNLRVPIMFVQGSKDGLCPLDKLQEVIKRMTTSTKLHIIEGGDHSFKVGKKNLEMQGTTEEKLEKTAAESIHAFLHEVLNVTF